MLKRRAKKNIQRAVDNKGHSPEHSWHRGFGLFHFTEQALNSSPPNYTPVIIKEVFMDSQEMLSHSEFLISFFFKQET